MKPIYVLVLLLLTSSCLRRPRYAYHPPPDTPTVAPPPQVAAQDQRQVAPRVSDNPADWARRLPPAPQWSAFWRPLNQAATPLPNRVVYRSKPSPWWVYAAVAAAGVTLGVYAHRYLPALIMRLPLS